MRDEGGRVIMAPSMLSDVLAKAREGGLPRGLRAWILGALALVGSVGAPALACSVGTSSGAGPRRVPFHLWWGERSRAFVGELVAVEPRGEQNRFYLAVERGWGRAEPIEWFDSSSDSCGFSGEIGERYAVALDDHRGQRRVDFVEEAREPRRYSSRWRSAKLVRELDAEALHGARREVADRIAYRFPECDGPTYRALLPLRDLGRRQGGTAPISLADREVGEASFGWDPRDRPDKVNAVFVSLPPTRGCFVALRGWLRCVDSGETVPISCVRGYPAAPDLFFQVDTDPTLCSAADLELTVQVLPYPAYLAR